MTRFTANLFGLILLLVLTACSAAPSTAYPAPNATELLPADGYPAPGNTSPTIATTSITPASPSVAPTSVPEIMPFDQSGCPVDDTGRHVCPPDSPLGRLGCNWIEAPDAGLSNLEPQVPLNVCWSTGVGGQRLPPEEYVYRKGCMLPQYVHYVIQKDGEFVLLKSRADLQKVYAPITSENEALSYALAATGFQAISGFTAPPNYRTFVDKVKDSQAVPTDQGYLVNLYDYQFCGCGPHTTFAVDISVKTDGTVEETGRTRAFEDPEQDGLCVD